MGNKYGDIRWKWLAEKGFDVLADKHQYAYMQSLWTSPDIVQGVFCESPAGTGKTTLAVLAGAYEVEAGNYDRIIYIRNAVPVRDVGFLPGDMKEKEGPYMAPLIDALEYVKPGTYEKWSEVIPETKQLPKVVATSTTFTRGITWDNSYIILDEIQNLSMEELRTAYTRPTNSSKIVSVGSLRQIDNTKLKRVAGLTPFEVFMKHFEGQQVTYHKLEKNYRGWFSNHADEVDVTVNRLLER